MTSTRQDVLPHTRSEIIAAVRDRVCAACWSQAGVQCTVSGPPGQHLRRYDQAGEAGAIDPAYVSAVRRSLPAPDPSPWAIIPDGLDDPIADLPLPGFAHQAELDLFGGAL